MTVPSTTDRVSFTGDGVTTTFPFTFRVTEEAQVTVYINEVLVETGYTVYLDPSGVGGNVIFDTAPVLDADGDLIRVSDFLQNDHLEENQTLPPRTIEKMIDKLAILAQQVNSNLARCFKLPITTTRDADLPDPTVDKHILYFDLATLSFKWGSVLSLYAGAGGGDGNVIGPDSATDGDFALFDGATGKLLKGAGLTLAGNAFKSLRVNSAADGVEARDNAPSTLTIASGVIVPTKTMHLIDTEGAVSTDNLNSIDGSNVEDGHKLIMFAANTARDIVVRHNAGGTGNIFLVGNADKTIDDDEKALMLVRNGANWYEAGWNGEASFTVTISSDQTLTAAASRTASHGLGTYPSLFGSYMRCTAADANYASGEKVVEWFENDGTYPQLSPCIYGTTSVIGTRMPASGWGVKDKTTGVYAAMTAAKWKQVFWWVA